MTYLSLAGYALSLVVLWRVWIVIYRLWFHPLSHVPGPFLGRISNFYRIIWFIIEDEHLLQVQLHEKYGPLVRYSPNKVIFDDASLLPAVFHMKADKTDFTAPNFGNISVFNLHSHVDHRNAKRRIAHAYAMKNVQTFEPQIDDLLAGLLHTLGQSCRGGDSIHTLSHLNFDIIGLFCFGRLFGFIKQEKDVRGLIRRFTETAWLGEFLGELDNLSWLVRDSHIGRYLLQPKVTDAVGIGAVMGERDAILGEMLQGREAKVDLPDNTLLSKILGAHNADGSIMSMADIKAELLLAIQAGSENASHSLALVIWNVSRHPGCQERIHEELDRAELTGAIPSRDHIVSYAQAFQLPYVGACIRESLRYSSSITQMGRKAPPETGLHLRGTYIPPGVSVSTSSWIVGRDKALYGEDAFEFRPSRWTEASPDLFKQMETLDFAFGYGARKCLGKHLAFLEIFKCVVEVFRRFQVDFVDPEAVSLVKRSRDWRAHFQERAAPTKPEGVMT